MGRRSRKRTNLRKMGQHFVEYLPPEIIISILMRLPSRNILRLRCVCKSWLSFTETQEFIMFYFLKSSFPCGLALFLDKTSSKPLKILEFVDEGHPCRIVWSMSFPAFLHDLEIHSSVNGLLFLFSRYESPRFICNPITREYIELIPPPIKASSFETFGFGASRPTGQYKVVRMLHERYDCPFECEVYTVGTGSWRSIAADVPLGCAWNSKGVFFNGNLHWLTPCREILCFDLETERFSTFATPCRSSYDNCGNGLYALGDCLYFCENSYDVAIWLMNEYGDDKSWRKECVIKTQCVDKPYECVVPIKIFRDGDILFTHEYNFKVYCYSSKTNTIREITRRSCSRVVGYTPSSFSLKNFTAENVSLF